MKRLLLIITLLALLLPIPVYAYTPPSQGTDNATDVILWGDNITIAANLTGSSTITISDLEDAMTAAAEAQGDIIADEMAGIGSDFLAFVLAGFIIMLTLWQRDSIVLRLAAVPVCIMYGLSVATDNDAGTSLWATGIVVAVVGLTFLYRPALEAFKLLRRKR